MFHDCHTADACKKRYRELAVKLHPDKQGGSNAAFQEMQAQYEQRLRELLAKQEAGHGNREEFYTLLRQLVEVLKVTNPQEYEKYMNWFFKNEKISAISQVINAFFPKQAQKVNDILKILQ